MTQYPQIAQITQMRWKVFLGGGNRPGSEPRRHGHLKALGLASLCQVETYNVKL